MCVFVIRISGSTLENADAIGRDWDLSSKESIGVVLHRFAGDDMRSEQVARAHHDREGSAGAGEELSEELRALSGE